MYELIQVSEQSYFIQSTVRSYLAWLKDKQAVTALFENNMLLWQRV